MSVLQLFTSFETLCMDRIVTLQADLRIDEEPPDGGSARPICRLKNTAHKLEGIREV